jgi:Na(+)-translocating NADH:ubiquinone oxidoreductase B subunit
MKGLLHFLEKWKAAFEDGKPLARMRPLFDALDNFMYSNSGRTKVAPHVRDPIDLKRFMIVVVIALLPSVIAGWYYFGQRILVLILISYVVGGVIEVLFAIVRKEEVNEGFLVTGMIYPLILPPAVPYWIAAIGMALGVIFAKELFGGTGRNLINPALAGRAFIAIGYPVALSTGWVQPAAGASGRFLQFVDASTVDALTGATPLMQVKNGTLESMWNLLVGFRAGSVGETCAALIIVGGVFLLFTKVANWRTVVGVLGAVFVFQSILNLADPAAYAPAIWHLMAGGLLFGTFFMATDPVTSPITNGGKLVYGILIGIVTVLIRNFSGYVEGVMFAILFGNVAAPLLDEISLGIRARRLNREA